MFGLYSNSNIILKMRGRIFLVKWLIIIICNGCKQKIKNECYFGLPNNRGVLITVALKTFRKLLLFFFQINIAVGKSCKNSNGIIRFKNLK